MSEVVERAARAMWEAEGVAFGWCDADRRRAPTWDDAVARGLFGVGPFRIFARAAIPTMREPTVAMLKAWDEHNIQGPQADKWKLIVWRAMIDAAMAREGERDG